MSTVLATSDYSVLLSATAVRNLLNSAGWVQLFSNNFLLSSDSLLSDFVRCDFGGYTPFSLAGLVPVPSKESTGIYQFDLPTASFACSGSPLNTVYGAFVQVGANWFGGVLFPVPIVLIGPQTIPVDLQWLAQALNL